MLRRRKSCCGLRRGERMSNHEKVRQLTEVQSWIELEMRGIVG